MYLELREAKSHGTAEYPFCQYHLTRFKRPFHYPVHWHKELEIIYVRKGPLHVSVASENYIGEAGSIFIINSGELHFINSDHLDVDYFNFLFPLEFISFQSVDLLENEYLFPLRSGTCKCKTLFPQDALPLAQEICEKLALLREKNEFQKQIETRILLLELLQLMVQSNMIVRDAAVHQTNINKELLSYLQQNFCSQISLHELADCFHLSEKYISRYFKEQFQLTLTQYLTHLRLSKARHLLITKTLPVTEIALQCGFANVSYFIRTFKEAYHQSPLRYRKTSSLKTTI